jgi:riboflavin kinase/FMN adenylyltransferase
VQIIENVLDHAPHPGGVVLTIGSFDGVHLGHRALLDRLAAEARASRLPAAVMTLRPHPRQFFNPENAPNILTSDGQKARLLGGMGVDTLFFLPFDATVANLDRAAFLEDIVVGRCGARKIVIGHDFRFGRGAQGTFEYLAETAPGLGMEVCQIDPLFAGGQCVSSTIIRERILQGELESVQGLLGRHYAIEGEVVRGRGIGKQLGFPTANVRPHNSAIPAHGVYAAEAIVDGRRWMAAVNVGIAPTIRQAEMTIEAHLLDFHGDLVGKVIEVVFHKRLRPEKKFPSLNALIEGIAADVAVVREHFQPRAGV